MLPSEIVEQDACHITLPHLFPASTEGKRMHIWDLPSLDAIGEF